jgi:hypothetical protein
VGNVIPPGPRRHEQLPCRISCQEAQNPYLSYGSGESLFRPART